METGDHNRNFAGPQSRARIESRAFAIQTMSSTGATRIGAEFLARSLGMTTVYYPEQTLEDLGSVFRSAGEWRGEETGQLAGNLAGFQELRELRYFDYHTLSLDMEYLLKDLENAQEGAVVFLQVSGHNPTGCDPDLSEWEKIADIIARRQLFPFFYSPCQGSQSKRSLTPSPKYLSLHEMTSSVSAWALLLMRCWFSG